MTLNKHRIDGLPRILDRTMSTTKFEPMLTTAGYIKIGTTAAKGNRVKAWWMHPNYRRVEVIYSYDGNVVVTAYHT